MGWAGWSYAHSTLRLLSLAPHTTLGNPLKERVVGSKPLLSIKFTIEGSGRITMFSVGTLSPVTFVGLTWDVTTLLPECV